MMFIGFIISAHRFLFNKKKITTKIENERGTKTDKRREQKQHFRK